LLGDSSEFFPAFYLDKGLNNDTDKAESGGIFHMRHFPALPGYPAPPSQAGFAPFAMADARGSMMGRLGAHAAPTIPGPSGQGFRIQTVNGTAIKLSIIGGLREEKIPIGTAITYGKSRLA
jgi:hypothetical protein